MSRKVRQGRPLPGTPPDRRERTPGQGPRRLWLFRLLAVLGAIGVALIAAEVGVRLFGIGPEIVPVYAENYRLSSDPVLRYELVPGSEYRGGPINSDGMRGPEYAVPKPAGVFRIVMIGDSICFGFEVGPAETLAARLEEYLNRYYGRGERRFEVLNLGVTGYNITQVVHNLRARGLEYDPDLILYAYALNDPQEFSVEMDGLLAGMTRAERQYLDGLLRPGARLASRCRLFMLTRYLLERRSEAGGRKGEMSEDPEWGSLWDGTYGDYYRRLHASPSGWQRVADGLAELGALARGRGVPAWVVVFPLLRDFDAYPLHGVHRRVADTARSEGLQVVDLFSPYYEVARRRGQFALDFLHPDAPGYAYGAVYILRELLRAGHLPVPDHDLERMASPGTFEGQWATVLMQRFATGEQP